MLLNESLLLQEDLLAGFRETDGSRVHFVQARQNLGFFRSVQLEDSVSLRRGILQRGDSVLKPLG